MKNINFRVFNKNNKTMIPDNFIALSLDGEVSEVDMAGDCTWLGTARSEGKYELMLGSGLKDRNGVEIYEGDILNRSIFGNYVGTESYNMHVIFSKSYGGFYVGETPLFAELFEGGAKDGFRYTFPEVVGNIYEQPHLLGGTV